MPWAKSNRSVPSRSPVGLLSCGWLLVAVACSSSGTEPAISGGALGLGGATGKGGAVGNGGSLQGGATSTGGAQIQGGTNSGGATATGSLTSTTSGGYVIGGAAASGGSISTGGVIAGGTSGTTTGGATAVGGATNAGGNATGGATGGSATGGTAVAIGGASSDRCDVGVYNSATPPTTLTLGGALGTHDPSALESNGKYYLFATGLGAKTSSNLTTWANVTAPFAAPSWAQTAVPGVADLWAADISNFGGKYHLYYSASTFGSNRSCIGHATKTDLASGAWTDQASATVCSNVTTSGDNWNAIDPAIVLDAAGTPWMTFGSFWSGIKLIQLDQNGARVGTTLTSIAARPSNGGALEGPYIVRRCGYFYLFTSWDTCCQGASSTYNIRVARATTVTGPYVDKAGTAAMSGGGTLMAQGDGTWKGPGGQSVMVVGTKAYLVYHAYAASNGVATLRIAELVWGTDGWPMPVGP